MRVMSGSSLRRTGIVCLVAGFLSGLLTMNLVGFMREKHTGSERSVVAMENDHNHDVIIDEHDHHGNAHRHGHAHGIEDAQIGGHGKTGEGNPPVVDLSEIDRHVHEGLNSGQSCTYTWTAVAHRHVVGGQYDGQSQTVADCQAACINRTDCTGVDFNGGRQCYLIVSGTKEASHADHQEEKHEEEVGCVHYDLMRACGSAADDDTVAQALNRAVRILCWVMTTPDNHMSKAVHVQATWGRRCNKLLFVTEKDDVGALSAVRVNVETGREHLTAKTMSAFQHVYDHHLNDADWFLKADDDTYVVMENLRYFLSSHDPNDPIFFGHHFKVIVQPQGYPSGGAGYVLSKEALKRFGKNRKGVCHEDQGAEDVEMGDCMQRLGVKLGDSRDALGRSRFHCFNPETHIHGGYPDWYLQYDKYGAPKGIESISDYAISFHYVSVEQLYNLEFYVYHLRPYGIVSGLQDLNYRQDSRKPVVRIHGRTPVPLQTKVMSP